MLGAAIEKVLPGSFSALQQVVRKSVPPKSQDLNMRALEAGHEFARTYSAG
jgi:Pyruvate/2-oxoacid:ferredoxin oxidoreductase gamma subunit